MEKILARILLCLFGALLPLVVSAREASLRADTSAAAPARRFVSAAALEFRGGRLFPTNDFFAGRNQAGKAMRHYAACHLKYAFAAPPGSAADRLYGGAYQGAGLALYSFGNRGELGTPFVAYLFQGARIVRLAPFLSFDYEWNFGLSWGWRPYDSHANPYNTAVGSRVNAYINTNFHLNWRLSSRWRLQTGIDLAHFSNGNTRLPNGGVNVLGARLGLVGSLASSPSASSADGAPLPLPSFRPRFVYDIVAFGSWRRKLYEDYGSWQLSPRAYAVLGAGLSVMYAPVRKLRAGAAFDVVYDASANEFYAHDPSSADGFFNPPLSAKVALGLSARAEFVMPVFTVGVGLGANVLHRGGDLKAFYQMLFLKIDVAHPVFLHVGYRLQEFKTPNYLMLGLGIRLNDRR